MTHYQDAVLTDGEACNSPCFFSFLVFPRGLVLLLIPRGGCRAVLMPPQVPLFRYSVRILLFLAQVFSTQKGRFGYTHGGVWTLARDDVGTISSSSKRCGGGVAVVALSSLYAQFSSFPPRSSRGQGQARRQKALNLPTSRKAAQ